MFASVDGLLDEFNEDNLNTPAQTIDVIGFLGKPSSSFYDFKRAMASIGHHIQLLQSTVQAQHFLETRAIKTFIVGLDMSDPETRLWINEMRKSRPEIKVLEGGSSISQVVKDNYFSFARGIDGTISLEKFSAAWAKAEAQRIAIFWSAAGIFIGILIVIGLTIKFQSPMVRLVGALWSTVLIIELLYVLFAYWIRLSRGAKWLPTSLYQ